MTVFVKTGTLMDYYKREVLKNKTSVNLRKFDKWKKTIASALNWKKDVNVLHYFYNDIMDRNNQVDWAYGVRYCVNFIKYLRIVFRENQEMRDLLTVDDPRCLDRLKGIAKDTVLDLEELKCQEKGIPSVPHGNAVDWYSPNDDWEALTLQSDKSTKN